MRPHPHNDGVHARTVAEWNDEGEAAVALNREIAPAAIGVVLAESETGRILAARLRKAIRGQGVRRDCSNRLRHRLVMNGDRVDLIAVHRLPAAQDLIADRYRAGQRALPVDVMADEFLCQAELAAVPRESDSDLRRVRVEDR